VLSENVCTKNCGSSILYIYYICRRANIMGLTDVSATLDCTSSKIKQARGSVVLNIVQLYRVNLVRLVPFGTFEIKIFNMLNKQVMFV
jgi:hypothetical protein